MAKRLVDVENSNLYLFNLLFRHQVYLEGVKAGFNGAFRLVLRSLYNEFAKFVGQSRYDTLDGYSRVQLKQFVYRFERAQRTAFNEYTQKLINLLVAFLAVDVKVTQAIYEAVNVYPGAQPKAPVASNEPAIGTEAGNNQLWATIQDTIVPATGMTIRQMLAAFTASAVAKVTNRINMAYANGESLREMLAAIIGDSETMYRDGMFVLFNNQNAAIVATLTQHVSALAQAAVAQPFYGKDQWVSIIDNKTTIICQSRNGNIYPAGEGPYPPAHWWCRSKRVPLTNGDALHDIPDTFYEWASTQPESFLNDALGAALAARVLAGASDVRDISVNHAVIPLTLNEFGGKIDSITM